MSDLQAMATAVTRFGTHSLIEQSCPSCGTFPLRGFYAVRGVPVCTAREIPSQAEAINIQRGDIHLAYCWKCGFVTNISYLPSVVQPSAHCDDALETSDIYKGFQNKLANYLVDNFNLHKKKIVDIGGGSVDFLKMVCELGNDEGIKFDPEGLPEQELPLSQIKIKLVREDFTEKSASKIGDFYICRMKLPHVQQVKEYVRMVRKAIGDRPKVTVFFQMPEMFRLLRELAFWDIYYEHCSYFSAGSLGRLFRACGFDVLDLWTDFDGQYLMIEARPGVSGPLVPPLPQENDLQELLPLAGYFSQAIKQKVSGWRDRLQEYRRAGLRVVLWGGGSKAAAFLTVLGISDEILYVVDNHPDQQNSYIAGTGQQVVSPSFLQEYCPDVVVVMNPPYIDEIRKTLIGMNLSPDLIPVNT